MTDYRAMPPGPELDVLVAERIFGFRWDRGNDDAPGYDGRRTLWGPERDQNWEKKHARPWPFDDGAYACIWKRGGDLSTWLCDRPMLPQFSKDISWAWLVVEELNLLVYRKLDVWISGIWVYALSGVAEEDGMGETAELAICRAGLTIIERRIKAGGYPGPKDWSPKGRVP